MAAEAKVIDVTPEPADPPRSSIFQFKRGSLQRSRHMREQWLIEAPAWLEPAELTESDLWTLAAPMFHVWDEITVVRSDRAWVATLLVMEQSNTFVSLALVHIAKLPGIEPQYSDLPAGHSIRWTGPKTLFGVLRGADLLKDGFVNAMEARKWFDAHVSRAA